MQSVPEDPEWSVARKKNRNTGVFDHREFVAVLGEHVVNVLIIDAESLVGETAEMLSEEPAALRR